MTVFNFKEVIDVPQWRTMAIAMTVSAAGSSLAFDGRNSENRNHCIYYLVSNVALNRYCIKNDEWQGLASPALVGMFGVGACSAFAASAGPNGVVGTGCTTTAIVLSTALPAAVGPNQLANRGDGIGYPIRIVGNTAGGSGRTEERLIVANSGGVTPTLTLNSPLTFTPASGARYELLAGRVLLCGAGTQSWGSVRVYDIATNSFITLSHSNLPASIGTDASPVMLDEQYVPHNRMPGEGFFGNLTCTGAAASTITGHVTGGDSTVLANEYRNFQIRIVRDETNPTAAGQRRIIASHTTGASPVYTLATAWTVTPSAGALYVIENNNDLILFTNSMAPVYSYRLGGFTGDGTWSISGTPGTNGAIAYATRGHTFTAGICSFPSYGIVLDAAKNARHSFVHSLRGGVVALDVLDIAGGANGTWTTDVPYGGRSVVWGNGTTGCYDACTLGGRYGYINHNATQRFMRFDVLNRVLEPYAYLPYAQGAAVPGTKVAVVPFIDGAAKLGMLYALQSSGTVFWNCVLQR